MISTNENSTSGTNDITVLYRKHLAESYDFSVNKLDIGNCGVISFTNSDNSVCRILGSHILNSKANNNVVGKFMAEHKVAAIFGDTNMSTKASSSLSHGFTTVESTQSVTDNCQFSFSNSAATKMFDKLLVRNIFW